MSYSKDVERFDDYYAEVGPVCVVFETEKAFRVQLEEDASVKFWIPKSQMRELTVQEVGDVGHVELPKWLVREKEEECNTALAVDDLGLAKYGEAPVYPEDTDDIPF